MQIGILNLPETTNAINSDSFIINTSSNEGVTKRILFSSIQLGLENTTLTPTITSHSRDITEIYANIYSLSAQSAYLNSYLNNLINSTVTNAFASLTDVLFPLSCIKCTSSNINPGYYIPNTNWVSVNQGLLIAGVTNSQLPTVDKNGISVTIYPGTLGNFNLGEYSDILDTTTIPAHTHQAQLRGDSGIVSSTLPGTDVESAAGNPLNVTAAITSDTAGESVPHNNIPPLYGLYFWMRVGIDQGTSVVTVAPVTLPTAAPVTAPAAPIPDERFVPTLPDIPIFVSTMGPNSLNPVSSPRQPFNGLTGIIPPIGSGPAIPTFNTTIYIENQIFTIFGRSSFVETLL
jgi:hypothetical protein